MKCKICGNTEFKNILKIKDIRYNINDKEFIIIKCKKCGTLITTEKNSIVDGYKYYPKEYGNFQKINYDKYYPKYSSKIFGLNYVVKGRLAFLNNLKINNNSKILDVGSGNSSITYYIKKKYQCKIEGIEPSKKAVNFAKKNGLNVFNGTLEDYNNSSEKFDYILLIHLIEHLKDPKNSMKKLYSLLNKKGKIVIACPNVNSIERKIFKKYWDGWDMPRHIHHFNPKALNFLLTEVGFKNIEVYYEQYSLLQRSIANCLYSDIPYPIRKGKLKLPKISYLLNIFGLIQAIFKNSSAIQIIAQK